MEVGGWGLGDGDGRWAQAGVSRVVDGDLLDQFCELSYGQQQALLTGRVRKEEVEGMGGVERNWPPFLKREVELDEGMTLPRQAVLRLMEKMQQMGV